MINYLISIFIYRLKTGLFFVFFTCFTLRHWFHIYICLLSTSLWIDVESKQIYIWNECLWLWQMKLTFQRMHNFLFAFIISIYRKRSGQVSVTEDCLGFVEMLSQLRVQSLSQKWGFNMRSPRGQGYDGCSTLSWGGILCTNTNLRRIPRG